MSEAGGFIRADLDGIFCAGEELVYLVIGSVVLAVEILCSMVFMRMILVAEVFEIFGDEESMVETAGADVARDGREGDEDEFFTFKMWEGLIEDFSEGAG